MKRDVGSKKGEEGEELLDLLLVFYLKAKMLPSNVTWVWAAA